MTIRKLDKIPLSGLMLQSSPQNQGTAEVQYSVTGLQLGSPLLAVFGNESVSAEINNADVKFANGQVTEDTTMMIDGNKPLRFAGVVVLSTEQFAPMTVYIPPALFARVIPDAGSAVHPRRDCGADEGRYVQSENRPEPGDRADDQAGSEKGGDQWAVAGTAARALKKNAA